MVTKKLEEKFYNIQIDELCLEFSMQHMVNVAS